MYTQEESKPYDWMMLTCSWTLIITFGLMLCTIAKEDNEHPRWNPVGTYNLATPETLDPKEREALLKPRTLYTRIIDGRTEWRYRVGEEWVYPDAAAVAQRHRR
jgi:hypothetical protein